MASAQPIRQDQPTAEQDQPAKPREGVPAAPRQTARPAPIRFDDFASI